MRDGGMAGGPSSVIGLELALTYQVKRDNRTSHTALSFSCSLM